MSKPTITKLFLGGIVAFVAGLLLMLFAFLVGVSGASLEWAGDDVVGLRWNGSAWTMVLLGTVGVFAVIGGGLVGITSWIGALLNTAALTDKTWFVLLLVLGLLSFGFVAMLAYVIAGPDGTRPQPGAPPAATPIAA